MVGEHPLARGAPEPRELDVGELERRQRVLGAPQRHDLGAGFEEVLEARPDVGRDRRAAGGGLELGPPVDRGEP